MMTYTELNEKIAELADTYNAFAIAIDGMACSGKTTLANHLSKLYGAPVIHMSDFKQPISLRKKGWETQIAGDMDFERFDEDIVTPWMEKRPIVYDLWDEKTFEPKDRIALPDAQMYIIEGTYSTHPEIRDFYDLHLFLKVDDATLQKRLKGRKEPISNEELYTQSSYFMTYMTEILSDGVIDGSMILQEIQKEEEK